MVFLLFLLFEAANGASMGGAIMTGEYPACDGTQNAILECFKFMFDENHDDVVTFDELDHRFATANFTGIPSPFKDPQRIKECDIDGDGNLTMADWDSPNRTCLAHPGATVLACSVCTSNGFVMTPPDYFVQPNKRSILGPGEDHQVQFSKKQLDEHAAKDHTHAREFKKAAVERLERRRALLDRFAHLEKWKRKQLQDEALQHHMQLTGKRLTEIKKRLIG